MIGLIFSPLFYSFNTLFSFKILLNKFIRISKSRIYNYCKFYLSKFFKIIESNKIDVFCDMEDNLLR